MPRVAKRGPRMGHSPVPVDKVRVDGESPAWPDPDPAWCPIASRWYVAHRDQRAPFRDVTDAASLYMWAEAIHRAFTQARLSGQLLSVIRSAEAAHGTAEMDRRRARIELERSEPEDDGSKRILDTYRSALKVAG